MAQIGLPGTKFGLRSARFPLALEPSKPRHSMATVASKIGRACCRLTFIESVVQRGAVRPFRRAHRRIQRASRWRDLSKILRGIEPPATDRGIRYRLVHTSRRDAMREPSFGTGA